jgi:hypothetical protein
LPCAVYPGARQKMFVVRRGTPAHDKHTVPSQTSNVAQQLSVQRFSPSSPFRLHYINSTPTLTPSPSTPSDAAPRSLPLPTDPPADLAPQIPQLLRSPFSLSGSTRRQRRRSPLPPPLPPLRPPHSPVRSGGRGEELDGAPPPAASPPPDNSQRHDASLTLLLQIWPASSGSTSSSPLASSSSTPAMRPGSARPDHRLPGSARRCRARLPHRHQRPRPRPPPPPTP